MKAPFLIYFFAFFIVVSASFAQNVAFEKENFRGKETQFNKAFEQLRQGNKLFEKGISEYETALPLFLAANKFNPSNALLNMRIGICYLNGINKSLAFDFINKAYELDNNVDSKIQFYLGQCRQLSGKWTDAVSHYEAYISIIQNAANETETKLVWKKIAECRTGDSLTKQPIQAEIENLGPAVNSKFADYTPNITADNGKLYFTSRRAGSTGGNKDDKDNKFYEDIYISVFDKEKWQPARNLRAPLNTDNHDAICGLFPDGFKLLIFKGDKNKGDIFISEYINGKWTKPESAGNKINTAYHESAACLSPDGNVLFFVSDKPGGLGGRDIYFSVFDAKKNQWGDAKNIGEPVNSAYDEEGVFMHPDGKTLYFASGGHNNMGGYDIFYSVYSNYAWSEPQNLGYPINTPDDDVFISVSGNGKHYYFSSFRDEGLGEKDIYRATYIDTRKASPNLLVIKGEITDDVTQKPLNAIIQLFDLSNDSLLAVYHTDSRTGQYLISLPGGKKYGTVIYADGYLFETENLEVSDTSTYREITINKKMKILKEGFSIALNNIFFEKGKTDLLDASVAELNRLKNLMEKNENLKIEIDGYTDNTGGDDYNLKLSEQRAKAVFDFLVGKGIPKNRLSYKGFGKNNPVADNATEEGRKLNRRIEFKVIDK